MTRGIPLPPGSTCRADGCDLVLVTKHGNAGLAEGRAYHGGHGYCVKHHSRLRRHGSLEKRVPRPSRARGKSQRTAEDMLEEWSHLRASGTTVREAALRMGVSSSALDKALYRARLRGDERGNTPTVRVPVNKGVHPRRDELIAAWQEIKRPGLTQIQAAKQIGCSFDALHSALYHARKDGVDTRVPTDYYREDREILESDGLSEAQIAERLEISVWTLRRYAA